MLALTSEQRIAGQRIAARTARLLELYHAAKRLAAGMRRVGVGVYELEPAAVLSLRTSLAEAALELRRERKHEA
jgi:hypothetical protein